MVNPTDKPPSDETQKPEVVVSVSTLEQEVARVKHCALETQGVLLPQGLTRNHSPASVETAVATEYDRDYYQAGVEAINTASEQILSAYAKLMEYKDVWGFDLEPNVNVKLTRYGKAGSYNVHTGEVLLRVDKTGNSGHGDVARDVIHETIHLAVEHLITQCNISQTEKEKLVDTISTVMYPEVFSNTTQNISPEDLPAYREALPKLPQILKEKYEPKNEVTVGPESYPFAHRPGEKLGYGYASIVKELGPSWVVKEFNPNMLDETPKDEEAYARSQNPRHIKELQETQRILSQDFIYGDKLIPTYWVLGTDETGRNKYFAVQRRYQGRTLKEALKDHNQRPSQFFRENRELREQMLEVMWGTKRALVEIGVFDDFHLGNIAVTTESGERPKLKLFDIQNMIRAQRVIYGAGFESPESKRRVLDNVEKHASRVEKYEDQLEVTKKERAALDKKFGLENGAYTNTVQHLLELKEQLTPPA